MLTTPIFLWTMQQMTVLQSCATSVKIKNLEAQNVCHLPLRLPVSMLAVLPINIIAPIRPKTIAISGWYASILKTFYRLIDLRQKWLVSQPSITNAEPEMVAILKNTNSGQCPAQSLIQQLGKGGSCPYHCETQQMMKRVAMMVYEQVLKKMEGENYPMNIFQLINLIQ